MTRRRLLVTTGLAFYTPLAGCLDGMTPNESPESAATPNESPEPPEHCESADSNLELPDDDVLNENDIDEYVKRVEEHRVLSEIRDPEHTSISLSVHSVASHDRGFVVFVTGSGSTDLPSGAHGDLIPWAAGYYVDDAQVRVTHDHIEFQGSPDDANLDDPTEGQVIVC